MLDFKVITIIITSCAACLTQNTGVECSANFNKIGSVVFVEALDLVNNENNNHILWLRYSYLSQDFKMDNMFKDNSTYVLYDRCLVLSFMHESK